MLQRLWRKVRFYFSPNITVHVQGYDLKQNQLCLVYHVPNLRAEEWTFANSATAPVVSEQKTVLLSNGLTLRVLWLVLPHEDFTLAGKVNGKRVCFQIRRPREALVRQDVISSDYIQRIFVGDDIQERQKADIWLFIDRDMFADDNAERLYRYIMQAHPDQSIYFALDKSSVHWEGLQKEGFKLLALGSEEHKAITEKARVVISSQADNYVYAYFGKKVPGQQFVFLQHGIIKDDLSVWLSRKPFDLMITSTLPEYQSIINQESPYWLTPRSVALTGLPRHDNLVRKAGSGKQDCILFAPTWRRYLKGGHDTPAGVAAFKESSFFKHWFELLNSPQIKKTAEQNECKIVLFAHSLMQAYMNKIGGMPEWVEMAHDIKELHTLFLRTKLLVTDYSSVAFELALIKCPVVYYQFDKQDFYALHTGAKGYFNYEQDGFGPAVETCSAAEKSVQDLFDNSASVDFYLERMEKTFPYRDGKNCERVYQAIKERL